MIKAARSISSLHNSGFSLLELLVAVVVIGVLGALGVANFTYAKLGARNKAAQSDHHSVKLGFQAAIANSTMPDRFIVRAHIGPGSLPAPLSEITLSPDVAVDAAYVVSDDSYLLVIETAHLRGSVSYRYVNQDGVANEQVVEH